MSEFNQNSNINQNSNLKNSDNQLQNTDSSAESSSGLSDIFQNYYLEYASYVILERAIPHIKDGLKPVQRRILHSLKEMDDGRFNKVANVIGHCMRYHPHGDAAIGEALVNLGQKRLLIDTQGNWGHFLTGDKAAASRYIETRLSEFSKEVLFSEKITEYSPSYDGRSKEPVSLPIKFPLLLFLGAEGIAVGLACKVFPHNFCELLRASIDIIDDKPLESIKIYPDFPSAGVADVSAYKNGMRGGKIKHRAQIDIISKSLLVIRNIPHETTTNSVIESILLAQEKNRFKFKKIEDNTTNEVNIELYLKPGQDPAKVRSALYAFTKCQVSLSSNICVIKNGKPEFLSAPQLLKFNTFHTVNLIKKQLQVEKSQLEKKIFYLKLERIFIENKLYKLLESCDSIQMMLDVLAKKLKKFQSELNRQINDDDIIYLSEIKIRRISLFDAKKLQDKILSSQDELDEIQKNIENIKQYTKNYFKHLIKKYAKVFPRATKLQDLAEINRAQLDCIKQKVYCCYKTGFLGYSAKDAELVGEFTDFDELVVIARSGQLKIVKPTKKSFIEKNIIYVGKYTRSDKETVYNIVYQKNKKAPIMAKRCTITSIIRDRFYNLIDSDNDNQDKKDLKSKESAKIVFLEVCKKGSNCKIKLSLKPNELSGSKGKKSSLELDFNSLILRSRSSLGKIISKKSLIKINKISS